MAKTPKAEKVPVDLLGPIEHLVMRAVKELGKDAAYGMAVFEGIRSVYPSVSFGSVYTALERLSWKGYLESEKGDAEPSRGGRARNFFWVTGRGSTVLESTETILNAPISVKGLETILTAPISVKGLKKT
jgi:PadR family transcriptional regulator PadR